MASKIAQSAFFVFISCGSSVAWANDCPADFMGFYSSQSSVSSGYNTPNAIAFTALNSDGSLSSWGDISDAPIGNDYVSVASTASAFAALKADGSIVTWIPETESIYHEDGDWVTEGPTDSGYTQIASTGRAFAALKADGSIVAWGHPFDGGDGAPTESGFTSITANRNAFVAIHEDGTIRGWGGGHTNSIAGLTPTNEDGFVSVTANIGAFAGLKDDGSISTWGYGPEGGSLGPIGSGFVSVASNFYAFAALHADGSITAWGDDTRGDNGPSEGKFLTVASTGSAFAALTTNGRIVAWGSSEHGGSGAPEDSGYVSVVANSGAFAARKADGSISVWGDYKSGGISAPSNNDFITGAPTGPGFVSIASNISAFAALNSNGSITAWGENIAGGTGAPVDTGYISISSTTSAFAALKEDGSISVWGDVSKGGAGAPAGSGFVSINNRKPIVDANCSEPYEIYPALEIEGLTEAQVEEGFQYNFSPTISRNEPAAASVNFSISNAPSWANFNSNTGTLTGTPSASDAGLYEAITITVNNNFLSDEITPFSIQVTLNESSTVIAAILENSASNGSVAGSNSTSITVSDLQKIVGIVDIEADNETGYQLAIAAETEFSNPPTLAEIQTLIYSVNDTDGDGISDAIERGNDSDNDGIPDIQDLDSDNDTLTDLEEGILDSDSDGTPNYLDLDSDGDGIGDKQERLENRSTLRDTLLTTSLVVDDSVTLGLNGLADIVETTADSGEIGIVTSDADQDGVPDYLDRDSDNDGILDETEARHDSVFTASNVALEDDNDSNTTDTTSLTVTPEDADTDGIADYRDRDSDNDGLLDTIEAFGAPTDTNGDGALDGFLDANNDGVHDLLASSFGAPLDSDSDGLRDHVDIDSDGDGLSDLLENGGEDANGDGRLDDLVDTNGDGIDDPIVQFPTAIDDTDGDGTPDFQDTDSDNDGISDMLESGGIDADGDGHADSLILPSALKDVDADGVLDHLHPNAAEANNAVSNAGGGCSVGIISASTKTDPSLPLVALLSGLWVFLRRRMHGE